MFFLHRIKFSQCFSQKICSFSPPPPPPFSNCLADTHLSLYLMDSFPKLRLADAHLTLNFIDAHSLILDGHKPSGVWEMY